MRALHALLSCLVVAGSGCFLDPTCNETCDGDRLVTCKWKCDSAGKVDIPECNRTNGIIDCAAKTGVSGEPMRCRVTTSRSPACVDVARPCDPSTQSICTGENSAAACVPVGEGGFLQPLSEPVCQDSPNQGCHAWSPGIMCVSLPKEFCEPSAHPACNPDGGYDTCRGTPAAGFVRVPGTCGTRSCIDDAGVRSSCGPMQCVGDAGVAFCL